MQLLPIFRKSPFARFLLIFSAGIVAAESFRTYHQKGTISFMMMAVVLLLPFIIMVQWHKSFRYGWIAGLLSGMVLFMIACINTDNRNQVTRHIRGITSDEGIFLMTVAETPEIRDQSIRTTVRIKGCKILGHWRADQYKAIIYLEKDSLSCCLQPGDQIWANTRLRNIPSPGNPAEFDYRRYLSARGIHKQAYLRSGSWKESATGGRKNLKLLTHQCQNKLLATYQEIGLNKTAYGILAAITLGYRNDLEARTKQTFSRAGVMHVMALSGFNVAIIALAMSFLLSGLEHFKHGNIIKTVIIILFIWLFAVVTGLSPSVSRASVMIGFVLTGKLFNKRVNSYNILLASAFMMLAFSSAMLTDVSFQLSFAAVLGIIMYQPAMSRLLVFRNTLADKIWKLFTVSCAAQLATLPLTAYYFHQFPVYFWLTNLFVVPLVSVIICTAAVFLLLSAIHPLALFIGKILALQLDVLLRIVSYTETLPGALIENIYISPLQCVLLTVAIVLLYLFLLNRKYAMLFSAITLVLFFQLLNTLHTRETRMQKIFQVANVKGASVLCFVNGRACRVWCDSTMNNRINDLQYALGNFWIERGVADSIRFMAGADQEALAVQTDLFCRSPWLGNNYFMEYSGLRMAWLRDDGFYDWRTSSPLKVDLVLISGNVSPDPKAITRTLKTDLIILDSSVGTFAAGQWIKDCEEHGIPCWNVSEKGSYWKVLEIQQGNTKNQPHPSPDGLSPEQVLYSR
jgi:competence protein ComEC